MPISTDVLREAARRTEYRKVASVSEARSLGLKTVFLCHSHRDQTLLQGTIRLLEEHGWRVYVDWADATMPDTANRETAARIQKKILELDYFLFLATANSLSSRWCPWEIEYADGKKHIDRIIIVPTSESGRDYGSEYLQLYRSIDFSVERRLGVWEPGQSKTRTFVSDL